MAVLARASRQELEEAWTALVPAPEYRLVRRPETGLVMVRGRAGGNGQAFNAGEMTVTRCTVSLSDEIMGTAYVAGRDQRRAELAAVFDGLLQMPEHSGKLHSDVVTPLAEAQRQKRESRSRKAAATKVEFFTMVRGDE
jgi:alpha-D-ribose 1-methylphosphonate 5-triphosphate synthase subunit PhnG